MTADFGFDADASGIDNVNRLRQRSDIGHHAGSQVRRRLLRSSCDRHVQTGRVRDRAQAYRTSHFTQANGLLGMDNPVIPRTTGLRTRPVGLTFSILWPPVRLPPPSAHRYDYRQYSHPPITAVKGISANAYLSLNVHLAVL